MDEMLYITMTGAENTFYAQSVSANNLANVNTSGFKADLAQFTSMPVFGDTYPTRVFALAENPSTDFDAGALIPTNRDLDIAIKGDGWFTVYNKEGTEALTRNGSFKLSPEGQLQMENGLAVVGDGGEIFIPPAQKIEIGVDGSISYVPLGASNNNSVLLDRMKLTNPEINNIEKREDGLFYTKDGADLERDIGVKIASGFLESSNVNAVESITTMIALARQFEIQLKLMNTAEQTAEATTSVLSMS